MMGVAAAALFGCGAVEIVSPGARGLAPEQSAWIVSDDDVQIVSFDGTPFRSSVTFENNTYEDGVRDKLKVEPGSHVVEVRMDNGRHAVSGPMKLRLDTEAATTYWVTVNYGSPIGYQVHAFAGTPDRVMLEKFDR